MNLFTYVYSIRSRIQNGIITIFFPEYTGINTYEKRVKLFSWLNDVNVDIVLLQETHFIEYIYNSRWFGKAFHSYSDSPYSRGVSILFRKKLPIDVINVHTFMDCRRLLINFKYDEKDFTVVNVYPPNNTKDRIDFFKRVKIWTNQLTCNKENIQIAGDFNCILDNSTNNSDKSSHVLKSVLNDLDVIDLWSTLKTEPGYTWCDGTNTPKSRIDYIFISSTFPTIDECRDAVFNMKVNKSPGSDGLPCEFYKIFWNDIRLYHYNSLIHSYAEKSLSPSQKLSILTILHKKGDRQLLNNYRPLSLTNTDYKIIAFVLARRLQKIVNRVISNDQSAYIKGRFIGNNARTIVDIFEYCEQNYIDGILLFLDFQKAFDSVEWNFMFKVLRV